MTVFGFSTEVWDEMDQKLQILGKHNATMAGWWYTYPSEKYEFVSWDDEIPNVWKNKKCCKPPTRWNIKAGLRWKYVSEEENKHLVNVVCGMEEHRNGVSTKKRCQRLDSE